jgi:D-arabinose 1-dehydrogenase-like Zn-dependent alcohol dehydrogenase
MVSTLQMLVRSNLRMDIFASAQLSFSAPMLCGGLTMFSPLIRNGCGTTAKKVAIVGVGGL